MPIKVLKINRDQTRADAEIVQERRSLDLGGPSMSATNFSKSFAFTAIRHGSTKWSADS